MSHHDGSKPYQPRRGPERTPQAAEDAAPPPAIVAPAVDQLAAAAVEAESMNQYIEQQQQQLLQQQQGHEQEVGEEEEEEEDEEMEEEDDDGAEGDGQEVGVTGEHVPMDAAAVAAASGMHMDQHGAMVPTTVPPVNPNQLTLSFQGEVYVFDSVSPDKVQAVLLLLGGRELNPGIGGAASSSAPYSKGLLPEFKRLKDGSPPFLNKLHALYDGVTVDGSSAFSPRQQQQQQEDDEENEADDDDDVEFVQPSQDSPMTSGSWKRGSSGATTGTSPAKKTGSPIARILEGLVNINRETARERNEILRQQQAAEEERERRRLAAEEERERRRLEEEEAHVTHFTNLALEAGVRKGSPEFLAVGYLVRDAVFRRMFLLLDTSEESMASRGCWTALRMRSRKISSNNYLFYCTVRGRKWFRWGTLGDLGAQRVHISS